MIPSSFVRDLVTAGEAFDDFIFHSLRRLPAEGEEVKTDAFSQSPGGGALITAIAAARLGIRTGIVSGLSREGERLLRDEGVQVWNVRRPNEPPAITVAMSTRVDRRFLTFNGMNTQLPGRIQRWLPRIRTRHVHLALYPQPCRAWIPVVELLRRRRITTSWDFGWNPALRRDPEFDRLTATIDYLFMNRAEALFYSRRRTLARALDYWCDWPGCVIVTLGAAGSRLVGGRRRLELREPGVRARVVDTTGAGDAFNAGFLTARLRRANLQAALRLANRVGALSTRRGGGIAGLPYRRELS